MNRRKFLTVLAAGGASLTLSACDRMPDSAIEPWSGPAAGETDPRLRALSWALLAPNPHNLQSWIADVREPGAVVLSIDLRRLLPQTDPPNRQILIGCGAFLELLQMAAAQEGWRADIELMPEGDYAASGIDLRPFARVRFEPDPRRPADPLFHAIRSRHTNRHPYQDRLPELTLLQSLQATAVRPGITVQATTVADSVRRIRDLAIAGYRVEFTTAATWSESVNVMRLGPDAVADEPSGLPVLGAGAWWGRKLGLLGADDLHKTDGMAARYAVDDSIQAANATPAWIWLTSADNSRRTQIEAGRAYVRLQLAATAAGLVMHPNSQVLQEFAQMQGLYRAFHEEVGVSQPARVQMLARIGYAQPSEPSPRRPLTRILRRG